MLLIGLLIALGQTAAGEPGPHPIVPGACPAIEITSARVPVARSNRTPSFAATRIVELEIAALLQPVPAQGVLRFKVNAPGGFLYQTLTVPFATQDGRPNPGGTRRVDGSSRPLVEQQAQLVSPVHRRYRVAARFPVAGTLITANGLYGKWTVEPWLDGLPVPCGPTQAFVIVE